MKKYIILFAAAVLGASCTNLLDQDPTSNPSTEDLAKVDPDKLAAPLLSAAVTGLHTSGGGTQYVGYKAMMLNLDLCGNDMVLQLGGGGGWFTNQYTMANYRGQDDALPSYIWSRMYQYIYGANQTMEFVDIESMPTELLRAKAQYVTAQALTLRAFAYYHLICLFQNAYKPGEDNGLGVPFYTKTTEGAKGRGKANDIYDYILADCETALSHFKAAMKYYEEHGIDLPQSKEAISIYVTYMVQARTALTMGKGYYAIAASAADQVIQNFQIMGEAAAKNNGFQKLESVDVIWGYKFANNTSNGRSSFCSHASTSAVGYGGLSGGYKIIDERLYKQIKPTDWRAGLYYAVPTPVEYDDGTTTNTVTVPAYCNMKYNTDGTYNADEVYLRAAEAYFIKAEALAGAEAPDYNGAQQTLYDLISTRDPSYTKSTATGLELLAEIRLQKRIEMWGEGLEFFDNKRTGTPVNRLSSTNHQYPAVVPAGKDFTLRLPRVSEIERNPNIPASDQNPL